MENFKKKLILSKYTNEIAIFVLGILYFYLWSKFNLNSVNINNDSLNTAIDNYNFKPFISLFFENIIYSNQIKIFLGTVFLPSVVAVLLYKIFNKILNDKMWSISLTLLSIFTSENFPFIKFLIEILTFSDPIAAANKFENFEIVGFPIPSLSVFYFLLIFYFSYRIINLNKTFFYVMSFFWILGTHIHPVDGLLGLIYWAGFVFFYSIYKKKNFISKRFNDLGGFIFFLI